MRKGKVVISFDALAELLFANEGQEITSISADDQTKQIALTIEGPGMPFVAAGCRIPLVGEVTLEGNPHQAFANALSGCTDLADVAPK